MSTSSPLPSGRLRKPPHHRTPSLEQRWTNTNLDYNAREISPPPLATLTSRPYPRSIPLDSEEDSYPARQSRKHQHSFSELLPSYHPTPTRQSRSQSPIKEISTREFEDDFMPTLTGDHDRLVKVAERSRAGGGISSWFSGASATVPLGLPLGEQTPPSQTSRQQKRLTNQSIDSNASFTSSIPPTPSSATSMFSGFFSQKTKSPEPNIHISSSLNDELLTFNIEEALFPNGQPDTFSPAAFKNLTITATGLLSKLQTAYRSRTQLLQSHLQETEARTEEHEESLIRVSSLKSQLELMSSHLSEKDLLIKELSEELAYQKKLRASEADAREKSIVLVRERKSEYEESLGFADADVVTTPLTKRERASYGSTDISEDEESPSSTVFSRSMSPSTMDSTLPYQNGSNNISRAEIGEASFARVVNNPKPSAFSPESVRPVKQKSTFQKLLEGNAQEKGVRDGNGGSKEDGVGMGKMKCSNCEGRDARFAWDTVGLLKVENKGLKERVEGLEDAVEGALRVVDGYGLGIRP